VADFSPEDRTVERAEREAEAVELYAPPREDTAAPAPLPGPARAPTSPVLVGFLALLVTTTLCSAVAGGLMALWYQLTPIKPGFLSGLGETLMAIFCWMALTAFAGLSGIILAAGILGREGRVSNAGLTIIAFLAILAGVVCFIPDPESTFGMRGVLGIVSMGATVGLTMAILGFARRKWIGPPQPPPWMMV
jgi:hypothetical protein